MHNDRWSKHPDFPDATKRPLVITHKRIAHFTAIIPFPTAPLVPQESELKGVGFYTIPAALKLLGPVIAPQLEQQLDTIKSVAWD